MPLILVSAQYDTCKAATSYPHISSYYCQAFSAVGAVPVLASSAPAELQVSQTDALLLTGGGDLSPEYYPEHAPNVCLSDLNPARDAHEMALLRAFLKWKKPVFGICRGMQLMNVALGGTLWEDLPVELANEAHMDGKLHELEIGKTSWLSPLFGDKICVNSYHHQACRHLAPGLLPSAYAPDGLIEAFCHQDLPVYGVQWHPERMYIPGERNDAGMQKLFVFWNEIMKNAGK